MQMTRRERLMATIRGKAVDRPPVCFYELNGLDENPQDPDPFNIYSHPSWKPLIDLTREKTDRIVMRSPSFGGHIPDVLDGVCEQQVEMRDGSKYTHYSVTADGRTLTARSRRDPDINTVWAEEHLLKDAEDLRAFLTLPPTALGKDPDAASVLEAEAALGDTGIVMIDTPDPLCLAALLFDMATYTMVALTEPDLFHQLLERFAVALQPKTAQMAKDAPGRLWRIYGPEFAAPPYLPPNLFEEYVVRYVTPMVAAIHQHGGWARIHSHGRVHDVLDHIVSTGADAIDPIEPPPQGDVELSYVREHYGDELALFGNLEINDIEGMPTERFREVVKQSIQDGTRGNGRGFVLMPSACPYGRVLPALTLRNYEAIIEEIEAL